ncbi:MAG: DoxX family protein [Planctomycetota bacterium]|nr:DoxX family protein [Planctomycetota bacterium]
MTPKTNTMLSHASTAIRWLARFGIGTALILSSLPKIYAPLDFLSAIYGYQLTSPQSGLLVAVVVPWLELVCGVFLLLGIWVPGALLATIALFCTFATAITTALLRGLSIDCGCGGLPGGGTVAWTTLFRALLFLAISTALLLTSAHRSRFKVH